MTEFEKLYYAHIDMVYGVAMSVLANVHDAEDVSQLVFIKLHKALEAGKLRDEDHVKFWLVRVTRNQALNALRSRKRANKAAEDIIAKRGGDDFSDKDFTDESERIKAVGKSLMALPEKYRTAVYLFYYLGYSSKEIAAMLGKNHGTVRTWLRVGRNKLKLELQKEEAK